MFWDAKLRISEIYLNIALSIRRWHQHEQDISCNVIILFYMHTLYIFPTVTWVTCPASIPYNFWTLKLTPYKCSHNTERCRSHHSSLQCRQNFKYFLTRVFVSCRIWTIHKPWSSNTSDFAAIKPLSFMVVITLRIKLAWVYTIPINDSPIDSLIFWIKLHACATWQIYYRWLILLLVQGRK